ncbi:MAG: alpha/beta fold hydrolase [Calditrichia bacterium]
MGSFKEKANSRSEDLLPGAEPLLIHGSQTGLLFLQGFTASPFEGKALLQFLHQKLGITVSAPLLPGHGTRPEDMLAVGWREWLDFTISEYSKLKEICQQVFICGQSMGGTLTLRLAAEYPVSGIITLAGAVFLKDWRLFFLPLARHLLTWQ